MSQISRSKDDSRQLYDAMSRLKKYNLNLQTIYGKYLPAVYQMFQYK